MFYRIISDGLIVDACDGLRYVRWQEKNRVFLACGEQDADGIVSEDGSRTYLLDGCPHVMDLPHARAEPVTEEEYRSLVNALAENGMISGETAETAAQEDYPIAKSELMERLETLEESNRQLEGSNLMLLECLLEMSEIVYG